MDLATLIWIEFAVLVCGTIFAWYQWYLVYNGRNTVCAGTTCEDPFKSKCFYGALFFTAALIVNIISIYIL